MRSLHWKYWDRSDLIVNSDIVKKEKTPLVEYNKATAKEMTQKAHDQAMAITCQSSSDVSGDREMCVKGEIP